MSFTSDQVHPNETQRTLKNFKINGLNAFKRKLIEYFKQKNWLLFEYPPHMIITIDLLVILLS